MNDLFNSFKSINEILEGELLEISVRRHQISYIFGGNSIGLKDIKTLIDTMKKYEINSSYLTVQDDNYVFITFEGWYKNSETDGRYIDNVFKMYIDEIADKICTCPALEFVVSAQYIKCFLDKGGLTVDDLSSYEELMGAKGSLELTPQRPYLLFINENYYLEEETNDTQEFIG